MYTSLQALSLNYRQKLPQCRGLSRGIISHVNLSYSWCTQSNITKVMKRSKSSYGILFVLQMTAFSKTTLVSSTVGESDCRFWKWKWNSLMKINCMVKNVSCFKISTILDESNFCNHLKFLKAKNIFLWFSWYCAVCIDCLDHDNFLLSSRSAFCSHQYRPI